MKYHVNFSNVGGVFETRIVNTAAEAMAAAIDMIAQAHVLYHGDSIAVTEVEE